MDLRTILIVAGTVLGISNLLCEAASTAPRPINPGHSDSTPSSNRPLSECPGDNQVRCGGEGEGSAECISVLAMCDGRRDCANGNDEGASVCCAERQFRCPPAWLRSRRSSAASTTATATSGATPFPPRRIDSRTSVCLHHALVCDGTPDCPGGEDESACDPSTRTVPTEPATVPQPREEEEPQPGPGEEVCPAEEGVHLSEQCSCLPRQFICDGQPDCLDNADENDCEEVCQSGGVTEDSLADLVCGGNVEVLRVVYNKTLNSVEIRQNWHRQPATATSSSSTTTTGTDVTTNAAATATAAARQPARALEKGTRLEFSEHRRQWCCGQTAWVDGEQFILVIRSGNIYGSAETNAADYLMDVTCSEALILRPRQPAPNQPSSRLRHIIKRTIKQCTPTESS